MNEELFGSGEWWKRPCWAAATRQVYCPYPEEDIVEAVETLKRYFDSDWAADFATNPRRISSSRAFALENLPDP